MWKVFFGSRCRWRKGVCMLSFATQRFYGVGSIEKHRGGLNRKPGVRECVNIDRESAKKRMCNVVDKKYAREGKHAAGISLSIESMRVGVCEGMRVCVRLQVYTGSLDQMGEKALRPNSVVVPWPGHWHLHLGSRYFSAPFDEAAHVAARQYLAMESLKVRNCPLSGPGVIPAALE